MQKNEQQIIIKSWWSVKKKDLTKSVIPDLSLSVEMEQKPMFRF